MPKKAEQIEESKKPEETTPEAVGAALSEAEQAGAETAKVDAVEQGAAQSFDLTSLSPEQLQNLKALLDNVPSEAARAKKKNSTVKLRQIEGKCIVNFGQAFSKLVHDPESRSDRPRQHIPVRFQGDAKDTVLPYQDFMAAPKVVCEVMAIRQEDDEKTVGECYSKELKRRVPMLVKYIQRFFTVKLPDGTTAEMNSERCN